MFISTIIPTIGRLSLSRAVCSVLDQHFPHGMREVIVVNDSGQDLPCGSWQADPRVQMISTNRLNRSIARNTGAAIGTGRYLHFLDDDDWMLPGAFQAFYEATRNCSAAWIHGGFRMVDNAGDKVVDVFPEETGNCLLNLIAWEWLPLQSSIVDARAFFRVGGFAMLESLKGGFEDIDLTRRIALSYDFMSISRLVAVIRSGDNGTTTNYADIFVQNRQSRENALNEPGSYERLLSSARDARVRQGYWYGRLIYCLLASAANNFRAKRYFPLVSRLVRAVASLIVARNYIFQKDFWNGLTKPHYSRVRRAIADSGKELFYNTRWNQNT